MTRFQTIGERTGSQDGKETGLGEYIFFLVHILFSFYFFLKYVKCFFKKFKLVESYRDLT